MTPATEQQTMIAAPVLALTERELELAGDELRRIIRGRVLVREPMSRHTTFHIGGPADLFVIPVEVDDLVAARQFARSHGLPFKVIGNGSNLLVSDRGLRGLVVRLTPHFNRVEWLEDGVRVGAGVRLAKLVKEACTAGLSGLESTVGIPGTVGGAIVMNAGTDTGSMSDLVIDATIVDGGEVQQWSADRLAYGYRASSIARAGVTVVEARLRLQPAPPGEIQQKMVRLREKRASRQPLHAWSAGSVFKNLRAVAAGKALDRGGAKGKRFGDAQVSWKHANFFVNCRRATADDMLRLIEWAHTLVLRRYGLHLEPEIELVGM